MEKYIKHYREKGYRGLIQVLKIQTGGDSWLYEADKTVSENLVSRGFDNYHLSEIRHYNDDRNGLDVTELCFSRQLVLKPLFADNYGSALGNRDVLYYKQVRPFIGNSRLFVCGASVIIRDKNGRLLIGKRSDDGNWAFPAGSKELNESIPVTVDSETYEEFGIRIRNVKLVALFSGEDCRIMYPNGHKMQFVGFMFSGEYLDGSLCINDHENTRVRWADPDELTGIMKEFYLKRKRIYDSGRNTVFIE